jgi:hypothetical protein
MGVSVVRISPTESGDVSTQDVLNRFITAPAEPSSSSPASAANSSRSRDQD